MEAPSVIRSLPLALLALLAHRRRSRPVTRAAARRARRRRSRGRAGTGAAGGQARGYMLVDHFSGRVLAAERSR